jgi:hypothetical protein
LDIKFRMAGNLILSQSWAGNRYHKGALSEKFVGFKRGEKSMDVNLTGALAAHVSLTKTDNTPYALIGAAIISALIAAYTWHQNEKSKRAFEEYKRKEKCIRD